MSKSIFIPQAKDKKTEALLIFIRTTLKESFSKTNESSNNFILENEQDNAYVYEILRNLSYNLEKTVMDSYYLMNLIKNSNKNKTLKLIAKKEKSLIIYYSILVKTLETLLPNGSSWIPELLVICLLSEWILEKEKSTYFYPYLKKINYLDLITRYDNCKFILDKGKKDVMMNMYKISSLLIEKLEQVSISN